MNQNQFKKDEQSRKAKPLDRRLLRMHLESGLNHRRRWNLLSLSPGDSSPATPLTQSRRRALKRSLLTVMNMLRFNVSSR